MAVGAILLFDVLSPAYLWMILYIKPIGSVIKSPVVVWNSTEFGILALQAAAAVATVACTLLFQGRKPDFVATGWETQTPASEAHWWLWFNRGDRTPIQLFFEGVRVWDHKTEFPRRVQGGRGRQNRRLHGPLGQYAGRRGAVVGDHDGDGGSAISAVCHERPQRCASNDRRIHALAASESPSNRSFACNMLSPSHPHSVSAPSLRLSL
jgi:hypothetical protein